jgi:hypothetical protein
MTVWGLNSAVAQGSSTSLGEFFACPCTRALIAQACKNYEKGNRVESANVIFFPALTPKEYPEKVLLQSWVYEPAVLRLNLDYLGFHAHML